MRFRTWGVSQQPQGERQTRLERSEGTLSSLPAVHPCFPPVLHIPRHGILISSFPHPNHTTVPSSSWYLGPAAAARMSGKFKASEVMVCLRGVVSEHLRVGVSTRACY
jgi:hypothetical protein